MANWWWDFLSRMALLEGVYPFLCTLLSLVYYFLNVNVNVNSEKRENSFLPFGLRVLASLAGPLGQVRELVTHSTLIHP